MQRIELHRNHLLLTVLALLAFSFAEGRGLSLAGYRPLVPSFDTDSLTDAEIDSIISNIELDEVVVTAEVPAVIVRGDTTIVNASQFRVWDGAAVEELVKRIPGMEYDRSTKELTYYGRKISEINVNGETFFGSDLAIGLERLRADLIGKVKIYDKSDEADLLLNRRRANKKLVLDFQTKSEFDKLWMGSAEVEGGNRGKRHLSLGVNYFKTGGDNFWSNFQSGNKNSSSPYEGNRADALYFNALKKVGKKLDISANLIYNRNREGMESGSYNEQYLPSANNYMYGMSESLMRDRRLSGMLGLIWRIDDKTLLSVNGRAGNSKSDNNNSNRQATFSENPDLDIKNPFGGDGYDQVSREARINDIMRNSESHNKGKNSNAYLSITRKLNEKGLGLSVNASYSKSRSKGREFSVSDTHYYRLMNWLGADSVIYRNLCYDSPTLSRDYAAGLTLSQELGANMSLEMSYNFNSRRQRSIRETFDLSDIAETGSDIALPTLPPDYERGYVDSLSNHTISHTLGHEGSLSFCYFSNTLTVVARMSLRPERQTLNQKTGLMQADTVRSSVNYSPALMFSWSKDEMSLDLEYSGQTEQPSLSSLLSLADNSDPLYVTIGNPKLKAAYSQDIGLTFNHSKSGLSASLGFANTYNSEAQAVIYNPETGGRVCYPVNINGNWNTRASVRYFKRFFKKLNLSAGIGGNRGAYVGLVNDGEGMEPERSETATQAYSANVRAMFSPLWGGIEAVADWRYDRSVNRLTSTSNHTGNYRFELNGYVELPCGLQFRNETCYSFRRGTNMNVREDSQVLWNLEAGLRFLKNKPAKVYVRWCDILNDKKSFHQYASSSGYTQSYQRQIGSYFMVGFEYRLDKHI